MRFARISSEDGFTVAEVLIAAAIMFIVLTAIIGLMGSSTAMTIQAKQKSALVNQVSSVIDQIRATTWAEIDTWTGERTYYPDGENGVVVVVTTAVETKLDRGQPYLKIITIHANGTFNGDTLTYQTRVAIRNPEFGTTVASDPNAPQIEFIDPSPPADEVLVGSQRYGSDGAGSSGSINIVTEAFGPADPLTEVRYEVAGAPLTATGGGAAVVFTPDINPYTTPSTTWNTAQTAIVNGQSTLKYADGFQTIAAIAQDASARTTTARRRFILDNRESDAPGSTAGSAVNPCTIQMGWTAARDGGTGNDAIGWYWASRYEYSIYREPKTGGGSDITAWPRSFVNYKFAGASVAAAIQNRGPFNIRVSFESTSTPALSRSTPPFSRLFLRVRSGGPTGMGEEATESVDAIVTPPELMCDTSLASSITVNTKASGTYRHTVTLYVTKPNFPANLLSTPSTMYVVQYKAVDGSIGWTPFGGVRTKFVDNSNYVELVEYRSLNKAIPYDWRVVVTGVTPTGLRASGTQLPAMYTTTARMTNPTVPTTAPISQRLVTQWE